jgi:polysaccharide biosynthesis protein PslH
LGSGVSILLVSPSLPYPPNWGFGTRVFHLLRALSDRHEVAVLSYARRDEAHAVAALRDLGHDVHVVVRDPPRRLRRRLTQASGLLSTTPFVCRELRSGAMQSAIDGLVRERRFDVVQVEGSHMCGLDFSASGTVVLDEHNVEYELMERMWRSDRSPLRRAYDHVEFLKWRRREPAWWKGVDACVVVSHREAALVHSCAPATPTAVVPNAVDVEYFAPLPIVPDPDAMVFTGLLTYRPNLDAALHFAREVLPRIVRMRPQATLTVVGHGRERDLRALRALDVRVTGRVPDVRPHLARAAVAVVPVRAGSGTRLKVLEGLAMARPMVSTRVGCEGLNVAHGEHLLVADRDDDFARAAVLLLEDRELARRLGEAGRARVHQEYTWGQSARRLEELYDVIGRREGVPT